MANEQPQFVTLRDENGLLYYAANIAALQGLDFDEMRPPSASPGKLNMSTFLDERMYVTKLATNRFSSDLTNRDDAILAILSLLLILVIESILSALLLRAVRGSASTFGFSIKHFVELARDFRFRYLIRGPRSKKEERRKVNVKLLLIATTVLLLTSGSEVLVLFLSSPHMAAVTNRMASFELVQVVNPHWNQVLNRSRQLIHTPCRDIRFPEVHFGKGSMTACMTSTISGQSREAFSKADKTVDVSITSVKHEFGLEHEVVIGEDSAKYSSRAYFQLNDPNQSSQTRIMRHRTQFFNKGIQFAFLHKQLVAFLFNAYRNETNDFSMDFEKLTNLNFTFAEEDGPLLDLLELNGRALGRSRKVVTMRHTTSFTDVIPSGKAALQFAQVFLAGSAGIRLAGPDVWDLATGSGNTVEMEANIWEEEARGLNWLSLSILLFAALSVLFVLRIVLKPIGTAELAGIYVGEAVGAKTHRSPAFLDLDESKYFSVDLMEIGSSIDSNSVELYSIGSSAKEWNRSHGDLGAYRG